MNTNSSYKNFDFDELINFFLYNNMCVILMNFCVSQNNFNFCFYKLMSKVSLINNVVLKTNVI